MTPRDIIRRPLITEKSTDLRTDLNAYAFEVAKTANKFQIRHAVESLFGVTVLKVRTMHTHPKSRRVGNRVGMRSPIKKAVVVLKEGDTIEFFEGV